MEKAKSLGIENIGDVIIPPVKCRAYCYKNVYGYSYPDKTKPKK